MLKSAPPFIHSMKADTCLGLSAEFKHEEVQLMEIDRGPVEDEVGEVEGYVLVGTYGAVCGIELGLVGKWVDCPWS